MAAAAKLLVARQPAARVVVVTVDTDMVVLMAIHGGPNCSVCLGHGDAKHRMCVDTAALAAVMAEQPYRLTVPEFTVVAASKGTDFCPKGISGLPDWHTTLSRGGSYLRSIKEPLVEGGGLNINTFKRMNGDIARGNKRAKVLPVTANEETAFKFVTRYWLELDDGASAAEAAA